MSLHLQHKGVWKAMHTTNKATTLWKLCLMHSSNSTEVEPDDFASLGLGMGSLHRPTLSRQH